MALVETEKNGLFFGLLFYVKDIKYIGILLRTMLYVIFFSLFWNCSVSLLSIRVAVETFMQLPYRAKKFRLYCTKPVTLHVDFREDNAELV